MKQQPSPWRLSPHTMGSTKTGKAMRNELPVPAFRLAQSRKAPMMVSAESLGAWIDKNEAQAKALWERGQV